MIQDHTRIWLLRPGVRDLGDYISTKPTRVLQPSSLASAGDQSMSYGG
jgi:hypothetical protein